MGDLKGHAIPGTFFLFYGIWWAVGCLWRFLSCRGSGQTYFSTPTFSMSCFNGAINRLPVEAFIKVLLSASGMLGELLAHLPAPPPGIVQHATMYFFFLLSGIVDICVHYGFPLPHGVDYMSMVLALVVEGLLFVSHVHGRTELDVHIHMLLVYVIAVTALVILLEIKFNKSVILGVSRAFLMMLQGSWFWAVGIILYGHSATESWDEKDPLSIMEATIYFCWHCAAHFIVILLLTLCMVIYFKRSSNTAHASQGSFKSSKELRYVTIETTHTIESDDN